MQASFKNRFFKVATRFAFVFVLMFVFRLLYGYLSTQADSRILVSGDFFNSQQNMRKNYASEKMSKQAAMPTQVNQVNMASSQKYEKTASLKIKSSAFENEEKQVRKTTQDFDALIQYEQKTGNKGDRQLHLSIGVAPEKFDSFYVALQKIGTIQATEISKTDKTNEYKQLNAQKASLEKTLASLNELKSKGGTIENYITLHDKILEVEGRLQALGVDLGNFDEENEFCTIKFSMYEGATEQHISFIHRLKVALEWTIKYYLLLVFAIACTTFAAFMLLLIADKLKILNSIITKIND
jgi:hypothetical protein